MKFLYHSILLIIAFAVIFGWSQTILTNYTIQFLAFLIVTYFVSSFIRRKRKKDSPQFGADSDIILLTIAIFLTITITGDIYSPLFFLLYFLGFGITFIFQPATVIIFVLGTFAVFLPEALKNGSLESFIRLSSIIIIAPLAFFFGEGYREKETAEDELEAMEERDADSAATISHDVAEVLKDQEALPQKDVQKLNEILEETETLREEKKN